MPFKRGLVFSISAISFLTPILAHGVVPDRIPSEPLLNARIHGNEDVSRASRLLPLEKLKMAKRQSSQPNSTSPSVYPTTVSPTQFSTESLQSAYPTSTLPEGVGPTTTVYTHSQIPHTPSHYPHSHSNPPPPSNNQPPPTHHMPIPISHPHHEPHSAPVPSHYSSNPPHNTGEPPSPPTSNPNPVPSHVPHAGPHSSGRNSVPAPPHPPPTPYPGHHSQGHGGSVISSPQGAAPSGGSESSGPYPTLQPGSYSNGVPPQPPKSHPHVVEPHPHTTVGQNGHTHVHTEQQTVPVTQSVKVPIVKTRKNGNQVTKTTKAPAVGVTHTNKNGHTHVSKVPLTGGPVISHHSGGQGNNGDGKNSHIPAVTTTDKYGNTIVLPGATAGAVITATDANGKVITTTYHPNAGPVRSLVVKTSTLSDGQATLITKTDYILPTAAEESGGSSDKATQTNEKGSLQTGNVGATTRAAGLELMAFVAGAVGVAWAI